MDRVFLKYFTEKLKIKKIVNKTCEQFLLGIIKYSTEDNRIDLLRRLLGIGDSRIHIEVVDCFLTILKNLRISFLKIFQDSIEEYIMNVEECIEIYQQKFSFYLISQEAIYKILHKCQVYEGGEKLNNLGYIKIRDLFLLNRFYEKSEYFFEKLLNEYRNKEKTEIGLIEISRDFIIANSDFDINYNLSIEIFEGNFPIKKNNTNIKFILLENLFEIFTKKKYFKIKIIDFVYISVEIFIKIYDFLKEILEKIWENSDLKSDGIIFFKEFEKVLLKFLGKSENKWKIAEYFK